MPCMLLVYRYIGLDCLCLACYWYIDILDKAAYALHATGIYIYWIRLPMPCMLLVYRYIGLGCLCLACY